MAGLGEEQRRRCRTRTPRYLLHSQLVALAGYLHLGAHDWSGAARRGCILNRFIVRGLFSAWLFAVAFLLSGSYLPPEQMQPGVATPNGILVLTNQLLNPAGSRIPFAGRPMDLALSPDANVV